MIEAFKKINPRAVDLLSAGSGGTPELSGNEIILGTVGCKPHYVDALIVLHTKVTGKPIKYTTRGLADYLHTSEAGIKKMLENNNIKILIDIIKRTQIVNTVSLSSERAIYVECCKDYMEKSKVTNKKVLLLPDDMRQIVRVALMSLIKNMTKEVEIYRALQVSESTYRTKHRETYNHVFYYIYKQVQEVVYKIFERRGKYNNDFN